MRNPPTINDGIRRLTPTEHKENEQRYLNQIRPSIYARSAERLRIKREGMLSKRNLNKNN